MKTITKNHSLTEFNNCRGAAEINYVLDYYKVDDSWDIYDVPGGITLCVNQSVSTSLVCFAPRATDGTVDIVKISKSYYVKDIERAVSQFLSDYDIPSPFGLTNKHTMSIDRFLDNLGSYMSIAGNTEEEIEESVTELKAVSAHNPNARVEAIVGDFAYQFMNGSVRVEGGAVRNFF